MRPFAKIRVRVCLYSGGSRKYNVFKNTNGKQHFHSFYIYTAKNILNRLRLIKLNLHERKLNIIKSV